MVFFELFQRNAGKPGFASQQGAFSPTGVKMIPVFGIEGVGFGDAFKGQQHRLIGDTESGLERGIGPAQGFIIGEGSKHRAAIGDALGPGCVVSQGAPDGERSFVFVAGLLDNLHRKAEVLQSGDLIPLEAVIEPAADAQTENKKHKQRP